MGSQFAPAVPSSMRRYVMALLGLTALGAGIWVIVNEHARNASCSSHLGILPGLSGSCQSVSWYYLGGFALVALGVILTILSQLVNRSERRYRRRSQPTEMELRAGVNPPQGGDQATGRK